jgi:hypothetical protein
VSSLALPSHWMRDFFLAGLCLELQHNAEALSRLQTLNQLFPHSEFVAVKVRTGAGCRWSSAPLGAAALPRAGARGQARERAQEAQGQERTRVRLMTCRPGLCRAAGRSSALQHEQL